MNDDRKNHQNPAHPQPEKQSGPARVLYDFQKRTTKEQEIFTQVTWCDSCFFDNLGMLDPIEFKIGDKTFLEGKCSRCGTVVRSEIIKDEIEGVQEDVIWPLHGVSTPGLTSLPTKNFDTWVFKGPSKYGYSPIRTTSGMSKKAQVIFWACLGILMVVLVMRIFHSLIYGP